MEQALLQLSSFSPSDSSRDAHYHARDFIASTRELLVNTFGGSDNLYTLLDHLDPSTHSLSYLLVLNYLLVEIRKKSNAMALDDLRPGREFWLRTICFLDTFQPGQVRYAVTEWHNLLDFVSKAAEIENKPFLAARPLRNAILRFDPTSSSLTIAHVYLTRVCLLARAYKLARPVIDKTIFAIPSASDRLSLQRSQDELGSNATSHTYSFEPPAKLSHTDHLRYFLYGGMIYMALKKWGKARHFLSIVISAPAIGSVSSIMVEAYKKWVLVNLLENGTTASPPKVTSPHALKVYKALARPYDALAAAFISGNWEKLKGEAEFGQTIWRSDQNNGLVQQVLLGFRTQAVRGLGSTFAAVTTTDVSERALSNTMDVLETERYIMALALQEDFFVSLVHPSTKPKASMLRFLTGLTEPTVNIEVSLEERLKLQHQKLEDLTRSVQTSDKKLEFTKEYVNYLRKAQKRNDPTLKDGGFVGKTKDQGAEIYEDMMDDLQ